MRPGSRGLVNSDRNNFAPRLGVAWRITEKTVLRGGYGLFFPTSAAQGIRDALASAPFNQGLTKSGAVVPLGGWPGGLTAPGVTPFSGGRLNSFDNTPTANNIPVDLQQPRIEQYNATLEHEFLGKMGVRVSYLGTRMHGLIGGVDLNLLPPSNTPFGTLNEDGDPCTPGDDCTVSAADAARRPFPELGSFLASYKNFGSGRSNALQVEVNRRFASGLTFNASYTLLSQKGSGFDTGNSSLRHVYNQFNPNNDFANDALSQASALSPTEFMNCRSAKAGSSEVTFRNGPTQPSAVSSSPGTCSPRAVRTLLRIGPVTIVIPSSRGTSAVSFSTRSAVSTAQASAPSWSRE
jgi:hypothetical protein